MTNPIRPQVGGVLSADIAVPEHERELRFYSWVLTTGERPLWREDLMNNLGIPIIGVGPRGREYAELPVQWMPHIQVADVAASVERASELGGQVLLHSRDDAGRSQWAVLLDPNGAAFGVIPVVPAEMIPAAMAESGPEQTFGQIAWLDLTVPDAPATRVFYEAVVGWGSEEVAMRDGDESYADYAMLGGAGSAAAGICHARGVNADIPAVWLIYLPVADLDESLRRVEEEGGSVLRVMRGSDGKARFGVVRDPVGAFFALAAA